MSMDIGAFIAANLMLTPVPGLADISLYTAHSGSRLSRLGGDSAPYWAYPWAGGLALAIHLRRFPELVAGRAVLDMGAGSGLVGIVAAMLGARVDATEIDPHGRAAIGLNAAANNVAVRLVDAISSTHEVILAGDVFYAPEVAGGMLAMLAEAKARGATVLIGDPGRRDLPTGALIELGEYQVTDFGERVARSGWVYGLR
jgi:predicted nicotinamide N-methyase